MKQSVIKYSPWGRVHHQKVLAPGIVRVHTASHGGIWLSPERQAQLPEWAKQIPSSYAPKPEFWEEDCEADVPKLVFYSEIHEHFSCSQEALERDIKMVEYLNFPAKAA